jgi:hypothetical protein
MKLPKVTVGKLHISLTGLLLATIAGGAVAALPIGFSSTVSGDLFANGALPGTVLLLRNGKFGTATEKDIAFYQDIYTYKALHETFHLAKQGGYDDEQMAAAAFSLTGKVMPPVPANITGLARASIFSSRFDTELKKYCAYFK